MPQDQKDPQATQTNAELPAILDAAQARRRAVEADPVRAVQPQVARKLSELQHRRLQTDPATEGEERRLLARFYQAEAGIAEPRHLSNQDRAELARDFRDADLAGRIALLEALEAEHGRDLLAVTEEAFEALPAEERPGARRIAERFLEDRSIGVAPLLGAQLSGLPEDLRALAEQVAGETARADASTASVEGHEDAETASPGERRSGSAELGPPAEAVVFLGNGLGVTDDWDGPAFPQQDSAFLAGLVDDILTAERDDLPDLIEGVEEAFSDDPMVAARLSEFARMRLAGLEGIRGRFGHGRREEVERELRWWRDRLLAGQDYHRQRRADRAAFARAEAVSGYRLRLQEDGSIAIADPGEAPLVTVGWSVAIALARNPEALRERFVLLDRLLTSSEPLDEQIEEINRAFGFSDQFDIETPTSFDEDTRLAILAANAAIREGYDPAAVRAGLIGLLFPEIHQDPIAWGEVLLDVLPIIGEARALADAFKSLDAFFEALLRGDAAEASRHALFTVLNAASVVPLARPLFKALGTVATKALRTRMGSSLARKADPLGLLSRRRLAKSRDRGDAPGNQGGKADDSPGARRNRRPDFLPNPKFQEVFGDLLPKLTIDQRKLLRGLWPHLLGKPAELDFRQLLKNAGFELIEGPNVTALKAGGKKAVFDGVAEKGFPEGFRIITDSLVFPTLGAKGTLFEFKLGGAPLRNTQELGDAAVDAARRKNESLTTEGGISVLAVELLRHNFADLPEALLEKEARRLLGKHANGVRPRRLGQGDVDEIVGAFLAFHRKLRNETAGEMPTIGEAFAALGMAASIRAAANAANLESGNTTDEVDFSRF